VFSNVFFQNVLQRRSEAALGSYHRRRRSARWRMVQLLVNTICWYEVHQGEYRDLFVEASQRRLSLLI
jgi:hypothetical protein